MAQPDDQSGWGTVREMADFDSKNHWLMDRGDGSPSVNLIVLSFVNPLRITCFSPVATAAAPYAISLAKECDACLTLLHVVAEPKAGDLLESSEIVASSERLLRNLISAEDEPFCASEYVVETGSCPASITGLYLCKPAQWSDFHDLENRINGLL